MPQIAALTLADGQTTPVNHTFSVGAGQMGETSPASWRDTSQGSYNGYKRITVLVRRAGSGSATRVIVKITDPAVDSENVTKYNTLFSGEFVLPDASTLQNKKDILAYAKNLFAHADFTDMIVNMSPAY